MNPEAKNSYDDVLSMKEVPIAKDEDVWYPIHKPISRLPTLQDFIDKENNVSRTTSVSLNPSLHPPNNTKVTMKSRKKRLRLPPMKEYIPDWLKGKVKEDEQLLASISSKSQESKIESSSIPQRFSLFTSENPKTIHSKDLSSLAQPGVPISMLFQSKQKVDDDKFVWWLDCCCATDEEIKALCQSFGIHPLNMEDVKINEPREKVEFFQDYFFLAFHTFNNHKDSEEFLNAIFYYFVVFNEGVISFSNSPDALPHSSNVRRRIRQLREYIPLSSDWICYAIIDDIVDSFSPVIQAVDYEATAIEQEVFSGHKMGFQTMLNHLGMARNRVMAIIRLLSGKTDVLKMLVKRCADPRNNNSSSFNDFNNIQELTRQPRGEIGIYLGDVIDHLISMNQNLSSYEQILSRSHTNYLAQLQVESVNSSNRVNDMLSKVSLVGSAFLPLSTVTGLWGMNVIVPGQRSDDLGWFFGIVGVIVFIVIAGVYLANHWINNVKSDDYETEKKKTSRLKNLLCWNKEHKRLIGSLDVESSRDSTESFKHYKM